MHSDCCSNKDSKVTESVRVAVSDVLGVESDEKQIDDFIHHLHHKGLDVVKKEIIPTDVVELMLETQYGPIKAWRRHKDITKAEMASRLDITEKEYRAIDKESSCNNIGYGALKKIADILGITLEQLDLSV